MERNVRMRLQICQHADLTVMPEVKHLLPQSNRILLIISRRTEHADELRDGCNHCCRVTVGLHEDGVWLHRAQFRQAVHMLLNLQHTVLAAVATANRTSAVEGKRGYVSVDIGGVR